jgi:hypothetical protein
MRQIAEIDLSRIVIGVWTDYLEKVWIPDEYIHSIP